MTQPSTTQVLALPARSEQYALFLTPIRWTKSMICGSHHLIGGAGSDSRL